MFNLKTAVETKERDLSHDSPSDQSLDKSSIYSNGFTQKVSCGKAAKINCHVGLREITSRQLPFLGSTKMLRSESIGFQSPVDVYSEFLLNIELAKTATKH